ncbi:MAG: hypothetical protein ABI895_24490 [Deltaproteobacteria bacterium]
MTKRVLGCVGAITLLMVACDDADISLIGNGGSGGSSSGSGGSAGLAGSAGQGANGGSAGIAGMAGSAGQGTGGSSGAAGTAGQGGSAGDDADAGDAGVDADSGADPDGGADSGTSGPPTCTTGEPVCSLAELCESNCQLRAAFQGTSGGSTCAPVVHDDCVGGCMGFPFPDCAQYRAMFQCFVDLNSWACSAPGESVDSTGCGPEQGGLGACFPQQ